MLNRGVVLATVFSISFLSLGSEYASGFSQICKISSSRIGIKTSLFHSEGSEGDEKDDQVKDKCLSRRSLLDRTSLAVIAGMFSQNALVKRQEASATIYLDPAMYGDQELRVSAVDSLRESVRRSILQRPDLAPAFYVLAVTDALSYDLKTGGGGPDGKVVKRCIDANPAEYKSPAFIEDLKAACQVLIESKKRLNRLSAITLPDAVALGGVESVASLGGPTLTVQLGRAEFGTAAAGNPKIAGKGTDVRLDLLSGDTSSAEVRNAFLKSGLTEREMTAILGALLTINLTEKDKSVADWKQSSKGQFVERGKIGRMSDYKRISDEEMKKAMGEDFQGEDDYDYEDNEMGDKAVYIADTFGTRDQAFGRKAVNSGGKSQDFSKYLKELDEVAKVRKGNVGKEKFGWIGEILLDKDSPTTQSWLSKYGGSDLSYKKDLTIAYNSLTQLGAEFTGGKYDNLLKNRPRKTLNDD